MSERSDRFKVPSPGEPPRLRRFHGARGLLIGTAAVALACAAAVSGCSAILGDFSIRDTGGADGATMAPELDSGISGDDGSVKPDGANTPTPDATSLDVFVPGSDSGVLDARPDVLQLPDVGPPGNPGLDLTAGGTYSSSANYRIIGALGESPGGNLTAQSASYKLQSGIIGTTQ